MSDPIPAAIIPFPSPPGVQKAANGNGQRLDSWKEIAAYLKRGARTVQRWERESGLPVHRLRHEKLGSVYAWTGELDEWWKSHGSRDEVQPAAEVREARSIAVLPFTDLSQEKDQQYFCDGIAEEIICRLAHIKAVHVVSRTCSFQARALTGDLRELGRRLHVTTVLEGRVRKSGCRMRITVQLTDVETGYQRWSGSFDREYSDVFAVQDEIAMSVVRALEVDLSANESAALHVLPTSNLRAYDQYLRGRQHYYQLDPRSLEAAVQLFVQAISLDPAFAQAYAGLADCWCCIYLYSEHSEAVREQALWAGGKAVEMAPGSACAQASFGLALSISARDAEAERAFEAAIQLDAGLFEPLYYYARHCFARGQMAKSLNLYEAAMRVAPHDYQAPLLAAQIYADLGRPDEAEAARRRGVKCAEEQMKVNPEDVRAIYMAANGLAALNERDRSRQYLERALLLRPTDAMMLYNAGCIYALLDLCEEALDCLDRAARNGLTQRGWYEHDSNLAPLRGHPRFQALLARLP